MTSSMLRTVLWALAAAIVIVVVGALYRKFSAAAKARRGSSGKETPSPDEAQPVDNSSYEVALTCRIGGHAYVSYDAGWRCATCGNYVARREGELYGPAGEGRTERRRQER